MHVCVNACPRVCMHSHVCVYVCACVMPALTWRFSGSQKGVSVHECDHLQLSSSDVMPPILQSTIKLSTTPECPHKDMDVNDITYHPTFISTRHMQGIVGGGRGEPEQVE